MPCKDAKLELAMPDGDDDIMSIGLDALNKTTTPEHIAFSYICDNAVRRENIKAFIHIYRAQISFLRAHCPPKTILATNDQLLYALMIYHLRTYYFRIFKPAINWDVITRKILEKLK